MKINPNGFREYDARWIFEKDIDIEGITNLGKGLGTQIIGHTKKINPSDEIIEEKGVKVFIDPSAVMYLLGTEMDYKKEEFSSSFVFKNPNETERCGCGESFKI